VKDLINQTEVKKIVSERRAMLSKSDLQKKSLRVAKNLLEVDEVNYAQNILLYASNISGEVDTKYLIDFLLGMGKSISLPRFNKSQNKFFRGVFLGWEKTIATEDDFIESTVSVDDNFEDIDLIILPSVAVSSIGERIGYGDEFYFQLLSKTVATKMTLAFEFQIFKNFEILGNEIFVDKIISDRRILGNFR